MGTSVWKKSLGKSETKCKARLTRPIDPAFPPLHPFSPSPLHLAQAGGPEISRRGEVLARPFRARVAWWDRVAPRRDQNLRCCRGERIVCADHAAAAGCCAIGWPSG
jgi:hypothetical protein